MMEIVLMIVIIEGILVQIEIFFLYDFIKGVGYSFDAYVLNK